jgi:hypothetical protein
MHQPLRSDVPQTNAARAHRDDWTQLGLTLLYRTLLDIIVREEPKRQPAQTARIWWFLAALRLR